MPDDTTQSGPGVNMVVTTVTVPFRADLSEMERQIKDIEDRFAKIPESFKTAMNDAIAGVSDQIAALAEKMGESIKAPKADETGFHESSTHTNDQHDEDKSDEKNWRDNMYLAMRQIAASLETINGLLLSPPT
jgi:phage host-nuclease inhibitor protein Gam